MSKKAKVTSPVSKAASPEPTATKSFVPSPQEPSIPFLINIVLLLVSFILVFILVKKVDGYKWVRETLIKENMDIIKKYPNLTEDQKLEAKLGFDYAYLRILTKTPENAVILMPPRALIDTVRKQQQAQNLNSGGIFNGSWSRYYLYPRQLVYEDNKATDPLYKQITHVAVLNYWGYDKVNYQVTDSLKQAFGVIPVEAVK